VKKIGLIKKREDGEEKNKYVLYLSIVLSASAGVLGVASALRGILTPYCNP